MQQMTLDDVVRAGQEGQVFAQQQTEYKEQRKLQTEQRAREAKQRATTDAANAAFKQTVDEDMQRWVAGGGKPQEYRPNDFVMLRGVEARSKAYATAGDYEGLMRNEVEAEKPRMRLRQKALQEYEAGGKANFGEFAKKFYATMPDGVDVIGYEEVAGGPAGAPKGAPSGPTKYRLKLSNGKSQLVDPDKLFQSAQMMLVDPAKTAEEMVKLRFLRAKEDIETDGKVRVEKAKGAEERATEGVKAAARLTLADTETQGRVTVANVEGANRVKVAGIQAAASKYSADKGAEKGDGGDSKSLGAAAKWQDMAKNHFGKFSGGLMGGSRIAGQATLDLAATAQRIHEANKGVLTESQALDQAAKFLNLTSPEGGLDGLKK